MNKTCGIYWIRNRESGKFYIGSSVNVERRWHQHRRELRTNSHGNPHLQAAWKRYGEIAFLFEVVEVCERARLREIEQWYIDNTRCMDARYGYNMAHVIQWGANNHMWGKTHSDETKQRLARMQTGRLASESTRKKMSDARRGQATRSLPVKQYDREGNFLKDWSSQKEAAKALGINHGNLNRATHCDHCTAGGYRWRAA